MNLPNQEPLPVDAREEACARAIRELERISTALKAAEKCLRRDWEHLAPRERSAQSRIVKELKRQQRSLEEEIEMNSEG